jgi:hypothetical protein
LVLDRVADPSANYERRSDVEQGRRALTASILSDSNQWKHFTNRRTETITPEEIPNASRKVAKASMKSVTKNPPRWYRRWKQVRPIFMSTDASHANLDLDRTQCTKEYGLQGSSKQVEQ